MSREDHDRLGTADLVAGSEHREVRTDPARHPPQQDEDLRAGRQQTAADAQPRQPHPQQPMPQDPRMQQPDARMQQDPPQMQQPAQAHPAPMQGQDARATHAGMPGAAAEQLAALFPPEVAADFRNRWDQVQIGFVDDPRRAVQQADELVAQVMKSLAASFAEQRARLEAGLGQGAQSNTEDLRVALRGYRSFFQRLLSL